MPSGISDSVHRYLIILKSVSRYTIFIPIILLGYSPIATLNAFGENNPEYEVVIMAGGIDRYHSIVSFYVPSDVPPGSYRLQNESDDYAIMQVDKQNVGWLIVKYLPRYEMHRYTFSPDDRYFRGDEGVRKEFDDRKVTFSVKDREVITYHVKEQSLPDGVDPVYARAGYIHPVRTPGGVIVTQDYAEVHPHHHGIWSAWTNVEFEGRKPDFWNVGKGTGSVIFESFDETWEGAVQAGFVSRHRYVDLTAPEPVTALYEEWEVRLYNIGSDYHIFDIAVTQTTAGSGTFILPGYDYGGVGFRGHEDWEGEENAFFLTSEGRTRQDGHGTRARWCHIGGMTGDHLAGVAIFDHPSNFRHPQPMHIHPRRTFFNYSAVKLGEMRIKPGKPYHMQYRYIIYDGEPDPQVLDRLWIDYAYPPAISITVKK
jgi:hypothetical protein